MSLAPLCEKGSAIWQALEKKGWIALENKGQEGVIQRGRSSDRRISTARSPPFRTTPRGAG